MKNLKELIEAQEELVRQAEELGLSVSVSIHNADIVEVKSLGLDAQVEINKEGEVYGVTNIYPLGDVAYQSIAVFSKFYKTQL